MNSMSYKTQSPPPRLPSFHHPDELIEDAELLDHSSEADPGALEKDSLAMGY
jgi:hypothetical protein